MSETGSERGVTESDLTNGILTALPRSELAQLLPYLKRVTLKPRQILHHSRTPMDQVYFLQKGLVSVSGRAMRDRWVEVWLIGSEGMTGIPVVLDDYKDPPLRRVVQVGGSAITISTRDLRHAFEHSTALRSVFLRYVSVVVLQISQSSACNAVHSLSQRLSRWLLLARDGLQEDAIPLTHQVLSRLLAVRRPSVTECLGHLEKEGSIRNTRARIEVVDPDKLDASSCECHRIIRYEYERVFGQRRKPG
jgi:CRP-like cAMP-binding protein